MADYAGGEILGYVVVTWPQTGGQPDIDAPGLDDLDAARNERDWRQRATREARRGERHEVAAVIRLEGEDGDHAAAN